MPVALFIAGNFWLAAAVVFFFGSRVVRTQPEMYGFLSTDSWFYPSTFYTCVAILVSLAVICFVLSYLAWRRQDRQPMRSTEAVGGFPVIPASEESRRGR